MRTESEVAYLLKAVDAFRRKLLVISPTFEILAANCPIDGVCNEEVIGKRCHEVFYGKETACFNCAAVEVFHTGKPALRPKSHDSVDTARLPCYYAYPILANGRVEAVTSMDFDLPSQERIEEKLHKSNALLRNLILSAVDGVIASDMTGKILIFNEGASLISGYSEEEALETLDIRDIYPEGLAYEVMKKLRSEDYGGKGKLRSYEIRVLTRDGEAIPISLNASIVYEMGEEVATIGFFHDLRESLKMKSELEKTQVQLLQSEKMASLGKLAAGVAHQLNNPLGGITLYAKLMLEEYNLPQDAREDLNRILQDAERGRDTVKELLEFTRQTRQHMGPQDINEAISRTLFLLENQTLFHNITIHKKLTEGLPKIQADIQQLNHLLMNIILNAAQAMEGRGELSIESGRVENEAAVQLRISDTGPGIPEETLPHIFEPFYTTKKEGEGTGLGLSLVYGIVENHGGQISAINNADKGATFTIKLPLASDGEIAGTEG